MATRLFLSFSALAIMAASSALSAHGEGEGEEDLVRLPGNGIVRIEPGQRAEGPRQRYLPGGGLLLSFDTDGSESISDAELHAGISAAFLTADANGDGNLSALEQIDWAASLPTRDDSLANPVQFDPNLDRIVSPAEFSARIMAMANEYRADGDSEIRLADLRAPERDESRRSRDRALFAERGVTAQSD